MLAALDGRRLLTVLTRAGWNRRGAPARAMFLLMHDPDYARCLVSERKCGRDE